MSEGNDEQIDDSEIEIGETVGSGAYGIVYKAVWNQKTGEKLNVAIKEIPMISFPKKHVLREFHALKSLDNEYVLKVFGYSVHGNAIRIVSDLMEGNLRELLNTVDLDLYERIEIVRKLILSIDFLHKKNMIHRDIKSSNFLYAEEGRQISVCDFGLATTLQNSISVYNSGSNKLRGSVPWIAPELMTGKGGKVEYDMKTDIYALGVTIWEVLTSRVPYAHVRQPQLILHLVIENKLRITDQYERKEKKIIPEEFRKIVNMCCERKPKKRPSTSDLIEYLKKIQKTISKYEEISKRNFEARKKRRGRIKDGDEEEEGEEDEEDGDTNNGSSVYSLVKNIGTGAFKAFKVVVFNQYVDDGSKENPDENI